MTSSFAQRAFQLLLGSSLMGIGANAALLQPAWGGSTLSQRDLLAQQVVDGLPPPPSFPTADPSVDLSDFPPPPAASNDTPSQAEVPASDDNLFMVYVNGSSPLLLEQVRQVQPDALIQEYDGQPIILVGAYENADLAEQQIAALAENGINATVSPVSSLVFEPESSAESGVADLPELPPADLSESDLQSPTDSPTSANQQATEPEPPRREIEFSPVPTTTSSTPMQQSYDQPPEVAVSSQPIADDAYYIVIPGSSEELTQVRDQIILLGGRQDIVSQRERPLGPHVLVGPFPDRQAASRWNQFLRDFGMNARVYYRR